MDLTAQKPTNMTSEEYNQFLLDELIRLSEEKATLEAQREELAPNTDSLSVTQCTYLRKKIIGKNMKIQLNKNEILKLMVV